MDAAALAWVTVSGMSLGSCAAPPTNTPGREVDSGRSRSVSQKPYWLSLMSRQAARPAMLCGGSMPTDNTIRSNSFCASWLVSSRNKTRRSLLPGNWTIRDGMLLT